MSDKKKYIMHDNMCQIISVWESLAHASSNDQAPNL